MSMNITLTKMDFHGLELLVEWPSGTRGDFGAELRDMRACFRWHNSFRGIELVWLETPAGSWSADNANPRRQRLNTLTKASARAGTKGAEIVVEQRIRELRNEFDRDPTMHSARCEIHRYHERVVLRELVEAVAKLGLDPDDKNGHVMLAAGRYSAACDNRPELPDNPWFERMEAAERIRREIRERAKS